MDEEERDRMNEEATYFYRDMMMVEDEEIKNELIWLHRLIFNQFICNAERYEIKNDEIQDAITNFKLKHPDFKIDFRRYGIKEE